MLHILQTREAFEGRLRTMQGLEFMVAFEPSRAVGSQEGSENVWVIRKQNRRKRQGLEDEITVLGSYFVINENIYMAPSVGNVVGSKMVCPKTTPPKKKEVSESIGKPCANG
jgi:mediator of RNA polymerase II transcription subunit 6